MERRITSVVAGARLHLELAASADIPPAVLVLSIFAARQNESDVGSQKSQGLRQQLRKGNTPTCTFWVLCSLYLCIESLHCVSARSTGCSLGTDEDMELRQRLHAWEATQPKPGKTQMTPGAAPRAGQELAGLDISSGFAWPSIFLFFPYTCHAIAYSMHVPWILIFIGEYS